MWKNDFCAECEKTVELLINYCRFDDIVGVFDTTKECDYILVRLLDKTSLCMPKRKLKEDSMIKVFLWSSLFFVFLSSPSAQSGSIHSKPNIVLIMADDLGYETLSVNGGQSYQTPNLDRLAHSGALFTNAFSQPLCTPSRVKLMTGLSNIRNYVKFGRLERSETTFANLMKKAGYKTVVAGKWQLGTEADSPTHFGFSQSLLWQHTTEDASTTRPALKKKYDSRYPNPELQRNGHMEYFDSGEYGPDLMSKYLTNSIANNKEVPFLIYYPMLLPHAPFEPTPDSQHWDGTKWGHSNIVVMAT